MATSAGEASYTYDKDGFLAGKTVAGQTAGYQYSSRGELLQVDPPRKTTSAHRSPRRLATMATLSRFCARRLLYTSPHKAEKFIFGHLALPGTANTNGIQEREGVVEVFIHHGRVGS